MSEPATFRLVCEKVSVALTDKGARVGPLGTGTLLLGGDLPLDSLDLAAIVVELERATGHDPFSAGFVEFQTIGDLVALFGKG